MKSVKVRFNLGRGKNYMKWKVQYPDGTVEYHHPTDVQLVMSECTLKNQSKTAQKIFDGSDKTVCAWVLCKSIRIRKDNFMPDNSNRLRYNPRVSPNWMDSQNRNIDGMAFGEIFSVDFGLYAQHS